MTLHVADMPGDETLCGATKLDHMPIFLAPALPDEDRKLDLLHALGAADCPTCLEVARKLYEEEN